MVEVQEDGVVIDALKESDKGGYPHRFMYDYEHNKLGRITIEGIQE